MTASVLIKISDRLYLRDPQNTELGRNIVQHSIFLIEELGSEHFTFRKLARRIGSTEASVYRYFENKHKLLVYLASWYWSWLEYTIDYETNNIEDARRKLEIALRVLVRSGENDPNLPYIDEQTLHRIVLSESPKLYLTKQVDEDNKKGLFRCYKSLCHRVALIVQEYNPDYAYPHALISTLIEAAHHQLFFSQHLPSLTEVRADEENTGELLSYLQSVLFSALDHPTEQHSTPKK